MRSESDAVVSRHPVPAAMRHVVLERCRNGFPQPLKVLRAFITLCVDFSDREKDHILEVPREEPVHPQERMQARAAVLANQQDGGDNVSAQLIRVRNVERVGMYRGRPYKLR